MEQDDITDEMGLNSGSLNFVAGVVQRSKAPGFERMLWRVTRGNVFLRRVDIEEALVDPATVNCKLYNLQIR